MVGWIALHHQSAKKRLRPYPLLPTLRRYSNAAGIRHDRCHPHCHARQDLSFRPHRARADPSAQRPNAIADPGGLSYPQGSLRVGFRADRHDHHDLPDRRLAAAAGNRHGDGQASRTLFACRRHDVHAVGAPEPRLCDELCRDPHLSRPDRHRFIDLPPGGDPHGALCSRRPARAGAGAVSSRRTGGRRARAGVCRADHRSLGAAEPRVVRRARADGDGAACLDRQSAAPDQRGICSNAGQGQEGRRRTAPRPGDDRRRAGGADAVDVQQECLRRASARSTPFT